MTVSGHPEFPAGSLYVSPLPTLIIHSFHTSWCIFLTLSQPQKSLISFALKWICCTRLISGAFTALQMCKSEFHSRNVKPSCKIVLDARLRICLISQAPQPQGTGLCFQVDGLKVCHDLGPGVCVTLTVH